MESQAQEYLAFRRRLGYALRIEGEELLRFARFADRGGHAGPMTSELAIRWAKLPVDASALYHARRLDVVRRFACYRSLFDPATEVPLRGILGPSYRRPAPHIYSDREIAALMSSAAQLRPRDGLRPRAYVALLGLLACTGLRISEAVGLTLAAVDLGGAILRVDKTKFHKARLVPLHPSAVEKLQAYAEYRNRALGGCAPSFFCDDCGVPLTAAQARFTFKKLRRRALGVGSGRPAPRLHDFRHTFAVSRLVRWYAEGSEVHNRIRALSTYMGHVKVSDTYWYLSAAPELLAAASSRFEGHASPERIR